MIDRQQLLADLQRLLRTLEDDLLARSQSDSEVPEVAQALRDEYDRAKKADRTALNFETWRSGAITQNAAAWVLSGVFVRFLEDNELISPPKISGAGERLKRARDEHELYFRQHPRETDREYLLSVFDDLAGLPGTRDVFGKHNPLNQHRNWLSGDAAGELLQFFQRIDADSGELVHDFTDPPQGDGSGWDTRFLGDLYQDLSEAARKKYALLQTPGFVEEFILDRTLEPALDEFGLQPGEPTALAAGRSSTSNSPQASAHGSFRMIDPACGSGHFLLGAFHRILDRWQRDEPGTSVRDLVQNTLDSIHGVDINPFAIAIARFRLLLAALQACGETKLANAPAFHMNLACGDSLYHGRQQLTLADDWTDESHYFHTEDAARLRRILKEGTFHCVVANPPYITPKDRAANQAYRKLYPKTCHRQYSLAVPFLERILRLAVKGLHHGGNHDDGADQDGGGNHGDTQSTEKRKKATGKGIHRKAETPSENLRELRVSVLNPAGYTGQITANSFMKREFGKKLIESFFPGVDLTHVIDTSGAYIPGHGTPTVILLAKNQAPVSDTIRTVMGIRGEPSTPADPSRGLVWTAIVDQIDQPGSQSDFVSVGDSPRELFHKHPWSIGGGGASELKEALDEATTETLSSRSESIGFVCMTRADELYFGDADAWYRVGILDAQVVQNVEGEFVRDWGIGNAQSAIFPYDDRLEPSLSNVAMANFLWLHRTHLWLRREPNGNHLEIGLTWFEWSRFVRHRSRTPLSITYGEVATHNHFVLDRGGKVFNRTAPVIKLPAEVATADGDTRPVTEDDHLALLGLLNSSTACFWMKQVCFPKGGDHVGQEGARVRRSLWDERYAFNATNLERFPLPKDRPLALARRIDGLATELQTLAPRELLTRRRQDAKKGQEEYARESDSTELCALAPWRETLATARDRAADLRGEMIRLQEDLDWQCYRLYGLLDEELFETQRHREHREDSAPSSVNSVPLCFPPINLGERAFEIVLARKMAAGEVQTTWFERHGSRPLTELPDRWPDDYKRLVERRIEVIETNPQIALIEQPEYKRRWNTEPWESQVERALKASLLDRLEAYFDFDGRMREPQGASRGSETGDETPAASALPLTPPPLADIQLVSVAKLADIARQDEPFMEVAEVYRDDPAFDVPKLVEELVQGEHVPLLPVLRYKPAGLRKRAEWEETWELQRLEDRLRAGEDVRLSDYELTDRQRDDIAQWQQSTPPEQRADDRALDAILSIPVPPKYKSSDFISTGGARYWSLRGKLDVPKERWISFPHCEGEDGTLMICWAGYDHLQQALAISEHYVHVQDHLGGRDDPRLVPLLACLIELLPWLKQWHNDIDPEFDMAMGNYFEGFIEEETRNLGKTIDEIRAWEPPKKTRKKAARKNQAAERDME